MQMVNLAIGAAGLAVFRTCELSYHTLEDIDWSMFDPDESLLHIFQDKTKVVTVRRAEDMRLVVLRNRSLGIYCRPTSNFQSSMWLYDIDARITIALRYKDAKCVEKNWTPFVYGSQIYLSYTICPHRVLSCEPETGVCSEVFRTSSSVDVTSLRGGTPAVATPIGYISIAHEMVRIPEFPYRVYYHRAYRFDKNPPFGILHITDRFRFPLVYQDQRDAIQFAIGLCIEDTRAIVSYGVADFTSRIVRVEIDKLLSGIIDAESLVTMVEYVIPHSNGAAH